MQACKLSRRTSSTAAAPCQPAAPTAFCSIRFQLVVLLSVTHGTQPLINMTHVAVAAGCNRRHTTVSAELCTASYLQKQDACAADMHTHTAARHMLLTRADSGWHALSLPPTPPSQPHTHSTSAAGHQQLHTHRHSCAQCHSNGKIATTHATHLPYES